jgi:hypothetical protein
MLSGATKRPFLTFLTGTSTTRLQEPGEIIGYSAGAYKNAKLVHKAFSTVKGSLFDIQMFHTDRGSEFDNALIDELFDSF